MSKIDYAAIKAMIKTVIDDAGISYSPNVLIESDVMLDSFEPCVNIELTRRTAPANQAIAAGRRNRYHVTCGITVWVRNFDKATAIIMRDTIVGEIEVALIANRSLSDAVNALWLEGGVNIADYIEKQQAFVAAADIQLTLDCELSV